MTMRELVELLVQELRNSADERLRGVAIEKYMRPEGMAGPVIYVTPKQQGEAAVAIGGQYADRFVVELRCEAEWGGDAEGVDRLLDAVDAALAVIEGNRDLGGARRGRIGEVEYRWQMRPSGRQALVAYVAVEYAADK